MIWDKIPSVSAGGKNYFLFNRAKKLWIVWNRLHECYFLESEKIYNPELKQYIPAISIQLKTINQGKKIGEKL